MFNPYYYQVLHEERLREAEHYHRVKQAREEGRLKERAFIGRQLVRKLAMSIIMILRPTHSQDKRPAFPNLRCFHSDTESIR